MKWDLLWLGKHNYIQWGYRSSSNTNITFPITFSDTNYAIVVSAATNDARGGMTAYSKTTSGCFIRGADGSSVFNWACSYLAAGM